MKLLTKDVTSRLLRNGRISAALALEGKACADFIPVVKLFTPDAACTSRHCLSVYARAALNAAAITERPDALTQAAEALAREGA